MVRSTMIPDGSPPGLPSPSDGMSRALARYRNGEDRDQIFRDLILDSVHGFAPEARTVLDIGCGHGFDGNAELQRSIAAQATRFIGVEPDQGIAAPDYFTEFHHTSLEDAPIAPGSAHVAYSAFVLEHVENPLQHWQKLHQSLVPGGVFWGFTVDGRHPFSLASEALGKLRLKDYYLDRLRGERGTERYENYPTFYRANTPRQIRRHARMFKSAAFQTVHREGQLNYYFPRWAWRLVHLAERLSIKLNLPGSILVVRLQK
jgi:SAM-dependent methyltransferase